MPRTPNEAGLIGVALKRKKEYKNTHKHQLINPEKLFKILNKLKLSGNKHYQFYDDFEEYQVRCHQTDPSGYDVIFDNNDDIEESMEAIDPSTEEVLDEMVEDEDDEESIEKEEEDTYDNNDPIKNISLSITDHCV